MSGPPGLSPDEVRGVQILRTAEYLPACTETGQMVDGSSPYVGVLPCEQIQVKWASSPYDRIPRYSLFADTGQGREGEDNDKIIRSMEACTMLNRWSAQSIRPLRKRVIIVMHSRPFPVF